MRNAWNSHDKSDSVWSNGELVEIGKNDLALMRQLIDAGTDHRKFMRMLTVTFDVTAPRYWWIEADTYKIATVSLSESTMHTITKEPFKLCDFSTERLDAIGLYCLRYVIGELNRARNIFVANNSKDVWYQIIQLLPQSYNQKRTMQMNYETLRNIYHSRKNHKLDEWKTFCQWIELIPYSSLITDKE